MERTPDLQLRLLKTVDYIWVECMGCGVESRKQVYNILRNLKANKPVLCRSCAGKRSHTPEARARYKATMLEKYGVDNPNRISK